MPRNNAPIIIGVAVLGILAIGLTLFMLRGSGPATPPSQGGGGTQQPPVKQFVAAQDIPPRSEITPAMLRQEDVAKDKVATNAITDPAQVQGSMTSAMIMRGQVITSAMVAPRVARVVPANIPIPADRRAVAVWVDPTQTTAGLIDVGDRVDVVVAHKFQGSVISSDNGAILGVATRTIVQDVPVLAVDRSLSAATVASTTAGQPTAGATPAPTPAPAQATQQTKTRVILALLPVDAERVIAANASGTIHLTIRNPSTREQFPMPEADEYPFHVASATSTSSTSATATRTTPARTSAPRQGRRQSSRPQMQPRVPPFPPILLHPGPPMPPPNKEVTVIRGTEKTRVIVAH